MILICLQFVKIVSLAGALLFFVLFLALQQLTNLLPSEHIYVSDPQLFSHLLASHELPLDSQTTVGYLLATVITHFFPPLSHLPVSTITYFFYKYFSNFIRLASKVSSPIFFLKF